MADTQARHTEDISLISQRLADTERILSELNVSVDSITKKYDECALLFTQLIKDENETKKEEVVKEEEEVVEMEIPDEEEKRERKALGQNSFNMKEEEQSRNEIVREINKNGRISLIDLADTTSVDLYHVVKQARHVVSSDTSLMLKNGDQRDDPCPELLLDESFEEKRKVKNMDSSRDFIQWLGQDMSMKILMCLDEPVDLVRATAVSSSWRQFVITNDICMQLCLRMFPKSSSFTRVVEVKNMVEPADTEMDELKELQYLAIEHRAYASLSHSLSSFPKISCIADAIFASGIDNYPRESILNTLEQNDRVDRRASYWSSKGASNVATPESLVYKLSSQLCVVDEVHIHPFQAYFQYGFPIYSAKAVRFHMRKYKAQMEVESSLRDGIFDTQEFSDDRFSWTYTSPEFPMVHENCLPKFSLHELVLCIGGILKVELLGRVQTQEMDGLYYFCINHVHVVGRPLSPAFDIEILGSLCAGVHWTPTIFAVAQRELVTSCFRVWDPGGI